MEVLFPSRAGMLPNSGMLHRYYHTYYRFVLNLLSHAGAKIKMIGDTAVADGAFAIWIDKKKAVIDYSDHLRDGSFRFKNDKIPYERGVPIFKSHYSEGVHEKWERYHPFSPVSFYDWDQYRELSSEIGYKADGETIINRQKPYGNAFERRRNLQRRLIQAFGGKVKFNILSQLNFWLDVNNCFIAIFCPGCRNDMLDRSPLQYMAFGCCIISPKIITMLAYDKVITPFEHYILCEPDYSDIVDRINWAFTNKEKCLEIGKRAKRLFEEHCTPEKLTKWMVRCLNEY